MTNWYNNYGQLKCFKSCLVASWLMYSGGPQQAQSKQVVSQLPFSRYPYRVLCRLAVFGLCWSQVQIVLWPSHMPRSGQEELRRTKARLVREQRQRTLRRQRQLLWPAENLPNNSDSESDSEERGVKKPDLLQFSKCDLCLNLFCFILLTLVANLLVWQYLLSRRV